MFAKWIQSYRDLPLLINQWANVVRWEMRTRLFLRTTEFLWQEGHTAHATDEEAEEETRRMLDVYATFAEDYMAIPVVQGRQDREREVRRRAAHLLHRGADAGQPGAAGRHVAQPGPELRQGLRRASSRTRPASGSYAWNTSWGVSTRLVGAVIMAHGDDNGLVLPPRLAPVQVVIVPIWKGERSAGEILARRRRGGASGCGRPACRVELDDRENLNPGFKFHEWELAGVPLRIELGPKDLEKGSVVCVKRTDREKRFVGLDQLEDGVRRAARRDPARAARGGPRAARRGDRSTIDELRRVQGRSSRSPAASCSRTGAATPRARRGCKTETKATIRCLAFDQPDEAGPLHGLRRAVDQARPLRQGLLTDRGDAPPASGGVRACRPRRSGATSSASCAQPASTRP